MRTSKNIVIGAVVVGVVAVLVFSRGNDSLAREYKAKGFQMVDGCNGGAAVGADGQVHTIEQLLEHFADSTNRDIIVQPQNALVVAKEEARVLGNDCSKRGHRENHPWSTNWATIKETLTVSEKLYE